MKNLLCVVQPEFVDALIILRKGGQKKGFALLCYEGGFLSIESGNKTTVMRAEGEWHGRATFLHQILQALAVAPPCDKIHCHFICSQSSTYWRNDNSMHLGYRRQVVYR